MKTLLIGLIALVILSCNTAKKESSLATIYAATAESHAAVTGAHNGISQPKDTISFTPNWNFKGDCGQYCTAYIAGKTHVNSINGQPINPDQAYALYAPCPTAFRFVKGKAYTFLATQTEHNSCSPPRDSVLGIKTYKLVTSLNN